MTSCKARFLDNNFAENNTSAATYSSQQASFPFLNCLNRSRKKVWIPSGCFEITTSGRTIYVWDGSDKDLDLTLGIYTGTTLAAHVQTILNNASSGWTVTYSTTTYKFTVTNADATFYVRIPTNNSNLTPNDIVNGANDAWGCMGFLNSAGADTDILVPAVSSAIKHSTEYFILDLGTNLPVDNICLIGPVDEIFGLSDSACVSIAANNVNDFSTSITTTTIRITNDTLSSRVESAAATPLIINDNGVFIDLTAYTTDTSYRFWKISIIDRYNVDTDFKLAHVYVGDYTEMTTRNLNVGFNWRTIDNTNVSESEDGTLYFDTKPLQEYLSGIQFNLLNETDRKLLMELYRRLGKSTPFYIQIDPSEAISDINELTRYCYFEDTPEFQHVIHDYFNCNLSIKEVI